MTRIVLVLVAAFVSMTPSPGILAQELIRDINTVPLEFLDVTRVIKGRSTTLFSGRLSGRGDILLATPKLLPGRLDFEDLNRGNAETFVPGDVLEHGTKFFFTAASNRGDRELWISDGTRGGTKRVEKHPGRVVDGLAALGNYVFFYAEGGDSLWKTDGTPAGTFPVASLISTNFGEYRNRSPLVATDDLVLFVLKGALGITELWRSDGTEAGTVRVETVSMGDFDHLSRMVPIGRLVYYTTGGRALGTYDVLQVTDGTTNGTKVVGAFRIETGGLDTQSFTPLNGRLVFAGSGGTNGMELWSSAGTTNSTVLLRDIWPGTNGSSPAMLTATLDAIYFVATTPEHGREVWRTDGTTEGTRLLGDIVEGPGEPRIYNFTAFGNSTYFIRYFDSANSELWRANASGLLRVAELPADSDFTMFAGHDALYVVGYPTNRQLPVWVGVVRESSPTLFDYLGPITISTRSSYPRPLMVVQNRLYFTLLLSPRELWCSDGSLGGTRLVATLGSDEMLEVKFASETDSLLFVMLYGIGVPEEFWVSDGTPQGTRQIGKESLRAKDIFSPFHAGRRLCFTVSDEESTSLWSSDGTDAGTQRVAEATPKSVIGRVGGGVVYEGNTRDTKGHGIYFTDGTPAGSRQLHAFTSPFETAHDSGETGARLGDYLYFTAGGENEPHGLWRTDGTKAGTTLVKGLGRGGYWPPVLSAGSKLYFEADLNLPNDVVYETWVSDGTAAGTRVIDENLPLLWPYFSHSGRMICLLSQSQIGPPEFWSTDGTPGGTLRLGTVPQGAKSNSLSPIDGDLFVEVETNGSVRWFLAPLGLGTEPLQWQEAFDPDFSEIGPPQVVGGKLLFEATTVRFGYELFGVPRRRPPGRIERGSDSISVTFSGLTGFSYRLEVAPGINGPWTTDVPAQEVRDGVAVFRRPVPTGDRFYRLVEE